MICAKCGSVVPDGKSFCTNCGSPIVSGGADGRTMPFNGQPEIRMGQGVQPTQPATNVMPPAAPTQQLYQAQQVQQAQQPTQRYQVPQAQRAPQQTTPPTQQYQPQPPKDGKSNTTLIVGILAAAVVAIAIVIGVVIINLFGNSGGTGSESSSASSAATSETSASAESEPSSGAASSDAASSGALSSEAEPSPSPASSPASSTPEVNYSTNEYPTSIGEFSWVTTDTANGVVPSGATVLTSIDEVSGGWKAYMFGSGPERFMNVKIEESNGAASVTIDWYYAGSNADTTPDSNFTGDWMGGKLDATGSGRIMLDSFWQQNGHQYAAGTFMWPSGEKSTIVMVRP